MMSICIYILSNTFNTIRTRSESEKENNYMYSYPYVSDYIWSVYIPKYYTTTKHRFYNIIL